MFVHGIGGVRDLEQERASWLAALREGAAAGGCPAAAGRVLDEAVFVDYSTLFLDLETQGQPADLYAADADLLLELVRGMVAELAGEDPVSERVLADVTVQLNGAERQGPGDVVRTLVNVLTTMLQLPGLRQAGQWAGGRQLLGHLAQVARYLRRGEADSAGSTLDARIRAKVHASLDGPTVVVAHSLGSVVAFESLHERPTPVSLLVTLGSPLAMSTLVWQRLVPHPPRTPESVGRWLNFWDRDDIVVARPRLEKRIQPSSAGVVPVSSLVSSPGLWVHSATKYLRQGVVAAPVIEALAR